MCVCACVHFLADVECDERLQTPEQDALDHIRNFEDKSFLEKRRIAAIKSKYTQLQLCT